MGLAKERIVCADFIGQAPQQRRWADGPMGRFAPPGK